jgi:hypothetical protein
MKMLHADEVLSPIIKVFVTERYGVNAVFSHERMRPSESSVRIKLLLQEKVHSDVQGERRAVWSYKTIATIEHEAARTVHEKIDFRA